MSEVQTDHPPSISFQELIHHLRQDAPIDELPIGDAYDSPFDTILADNTLPEYPAGTHDIRESRAIGFEGWPYGSKLRGTFYLSVEPGEKFSPTPKDKLLAVAEFAEYTLGESGVKNVLSKTWGFPVDAGAKLTPEDRAAVSRLGRLHIVADLLLDSEGHKITDVYGVQRPYNGNPETLHHGKPVIIQGRVGRFFLNALHSSGKISDDEKGQPWVEIQADTASGEKPVVLPILLNEGEVIYAAGGSALAYAKRPVTRLMTGDTAQFACFPDSFAIIESSDAPLFIHGDRQAFLVEAADEQWDAALQSEVVFANEYRKVRKAMSQPKSLAFRQQLAHLRIMCSEEGEGLAFHTLSSKQIESLLFLTQTYNAGCSKRDDQVIAMEGIPNDLAAIIRDTYGANLFGMDIKEVRAFCLAVSNGALPPLQRAPAGMSANIYNLAQVFNEHSIPDMVVNGISSLFNKTLQLPPEAINEMTHNIGFVYACLRRTNTVLDREALAPPLLNLAANVMQGMRSVNPHPIHDSLWMQVVYTLHETLQQELKTRLAPSSKDGRIYMSAFSTYQTFLPEIISTARNVAFDEPMLVSGTDFHALLTDMEKMLQLTRD